ncbi:hypothetical protein [Tenacibaculum ovolyticum]|uniref:hypothetical protein n=1 Tax=Tenacibaculum ovolyticum TaxID=104270 RepID=UPI000408E967|nr:hypothetical protein [Tenacibaculum ovolyticum]
MKHKSQFTLFYLFLSTTLLTFNSCSNNDTITPILNTDEYFKYTLNNSTERVFDKNMTAYFVTNPSTTYKRFYFRASANTTNGSSVYVDGNFTFFNYASFTAASSIPWGIPSTPIATNFYFTELFSEDGFKFFPHNEYNSSPINCTIITHAFNVGEYLEFTFTGNYTHITDPSITGTITGTGRMKRESDQ